MNNDGPSLSSAIRFHIFHFFDVGYVGPIKPGAEARTNVPGVSVVGLFTGDNKIDRLNFGVDFLDSLIKGVRGGPGIGTGKFSAADVEGPIDTTRDGISK